MRLGRPRRGGVEFRVTRPLTKALPSEPAAVRVYGPDGACATLCFDLDSKHGGPEAVERDEARLLAWLEECGAQVITDISPNGGRHVYVPLADRLDFFAAKELVGALASLFPTLDTSPHNSASSGCIRTPGARHAKSWGHQSLTMSLNVAVDILHRRNPAHVVQAMQIRLRREIAAWNAARTLTAVPYLQQATGTATGRDGASTGAPRGLSGRVLAIARNGVYDAARYASGHEARQAVLTAAAAAGWTFVDIAVRVEDGRWPGLAALYARYSPRTRPAALGRDWRKAQAFAARTLPKLQASRQKHVTDEGGNDTVHKSNTSLPESHGGKTQPGEDEHAFIRTWRAALRTTELHRLPGRRYYVARFLLRALGEAAHKNGNRIVQFGTRALAVATGVEHTTVSVLLHQLADSGWIDRLEEGRGEHADTWVLTLPSDLTDIAPGLRWDRGRVHALRPAFRELGHVTALVFEAVETGRARAIAEIVTATAISRRAVHDAVDVLTAWKLLERTPDGLTAHPGRLLVVAEHLGVLEEVSAQLRRYVRQRVAWHAFLGRHDEESNPRHVADDDAETWWWPPGEGARWTLVAAAL